MPNSPLLSHLCERGHNNNFNLIRLLAALMVLFSHSFVLATSTGEPLGRLSGVITFGELAVDIFFLTSGFLVTKSLMVRGDLLEFAAARALRIYPGLIVMVLLTVGVAGLFAADGFYTDPVTIRYVTTTALIWFPKLTHFQLPGLFESNPFPISVNGSLHTLPFELRMYGLLAATWFIASLHKRSRITVVACAIVSLAVSAAVMRMVLPEGQLTRSIFTFFTGATYFVLRDRIRIHGGVAVAGVIAIIASSIDRTLFFVTYNLLLGYILFAASYLPTLWQPKSDISYGTYIYAFPIQQTIAALIPGVSWLAMTILATPVVLALAWASWHWIEKPAMKLKRLFGQRAFVRGGAGRAIDP